MLRSLCRFYLLRNPSVAAALAAVRILLGKLGYWRSLREHRPVDQAGRPLPWLTYPALAWLDMLDLSQVRIFEYGAGWGTLHWAQRAAAVKAVETRAEWVEKIRALLPGNAELIGPVAGESYIETARSGAPWDVVIVDGLYRSECAAVAVEVLKPGGMIILDNADWFVEAARFLRDQGFTQVDFQGFAPCNGYTLTTSIFLQGRLDIPRLPQSWSGTDLGAITYQETKAAGL